MPFFLLFYMEKYSLLRSGFMYNETYETLQRGGAEV
ncbi:Uncharacterised protein [Streptococcus pneumoniae]|nr:hypothetical Protein FORC21_4540 [Bacillus cereus]OFC79047.1 hypothetical protein BTGOE3_45760 [Bacillus thuringiensis]CEY39622.1 Uncharacterised protein [Streptococcus pneumoniae]AVR34562.1 hypothetical protein FORC60_4751 [Bacillus cereus]CGF89921.1 Uncharacterised protein [Streptococcus pneumoniae]